MTALPQASAEMTVAEYLAMERDHDDRHEFFSGQVFAMAGASYNHTMICAMLVTRLNVHLAQSGCVASSTDLKIHIPATGSFAYPDVSVVCSDPDFYDERQDIVQNPVVLFEVLSPSTEAHDRGLKFEHYRALSSLREYVLVAQDRSYIEHFTRQDNGIWQFSTVTGLDATLTLTSLDCSLPLQAIYEHARLG